MQRTLPFPCAYAFKTTLHITFDALDQMDLMSESKFNNLVREIETRFEKEPLVMERALIHVVSCIDAENVVVFSRVFYSACSLFHDEKPPQLARGTCLIRSIFVTPGRLIFRPAQCPCLHPGDVQKFTAIDVPELHHVTDSIVFPVQATPRRNGCNHCLDLALQEIARNCDVVGDAINIVKHVSNAILETKNRKIGSSSVVLPPGNDADGEGLGSSAVAITRVPRSPKLNMEDLVEKMEKDLVRRLWQSLACQGPPS
ncbi:hypothetical protein HPB49_006541 [Dermacentor silvarum]|uniref:Uncharacterized protein n=1 Tax=Dermacentor silvarum TaxID=543639 RepID=A0ACB8DWQ5_DERSI|nr:hypothetical protein HPB49_006541 [Dermacentor silvarum]